MSTYTSSNGGSVEPSKAHRLPLFCADSQLSLPVRRGQFAGQSRPGRNGRIGAATTRQPAGLCTGGNIGGVVYLTYLYLRFIDREIWVRVALPRSITTCISSEPESSSVPWWLRSCFDSSTSPNRFGLLGLQAAEQPGPCLSGQLAAGRGLWCI